MAVVERDVSTGASRPGAATNWRSALAVPDWLGKAWWTVLSVSLFAGIWEICWAMGWADPQLLPPPHICLLYTSDAADE